MGTGQQQGGTTPAGDRAEIYLDITDAAVARMVDDDLVIDLRDHVVAAGRAGFVTDLRTHTPQEYTDHVDRCSGRPLELQPGHRLTTITGGDLWMAAEAFVYDVYVSIGYTRPNSRKQVEELARWADRSRFHAVVTDDDEVVGTVRTIFGSYGELPVAQFERTDASDPDPVCELSSLVVDPRQRSTGVIEHLYRAGWLDAWRSRSNAVVALIDEWLFDVFQRTYHLPFRKIGVEQEYMGTVPVPVALPLHGDDYLPLSRANPYFWAWTLEAVDLHEIVDWGLPITITGADDATRYGVEDQGSLDQGSPDQGAPTETTPSPRGFA